MRPWDRQADTHWGEPTQTRPGALHRAPGLEAQLPRGLAPGTLGLGEPTQARPGALSQNQRQCRARQNQNQPGGEQPASRQQIAGRAGEDSAAAALAEEGYEILTRNYHTREGEIDLVAKDKNTIVFVEVKCRRTGAYGCGAEAVDSRKQEKIRRAARAYLLEEGLWEQEVRFDVEEVGPGGIRIIKNAFWEQSQ